MTLFTRSDNGAFFAHSAVVVGDVLIGEDASFWFGAVVRGDVARVSIGRRVNVQDNAVIHCDTDLPNTIEDDVTIGHGAIVHGQFVGRGSLIGMHATLLGRTHIGENCLVAAGAVVPPGLNAPAGSVIMGVPGKIVRSVTEEDLKYMRWLSGHYVQIAREYVEGKFARLGSGQ